MGIILLEYGAAATTNTLPPWWSVFKCVRKAGVAALLGNNF